MAETLVREVPLSTDWAVYYRFTRRNAHTAENQLIYEVITKAGDVMRSTPVRPVKWTSSE